VGEQILISALADQIRADAAQQSTTITDGISDRRQLVTALRLLVAWGVVSETDGSLAPWSERPEDEALRLQPMVIETSSSLPLYQSLPGWAPMSAADVLEIDPTVALVVALTVPSITVLIWEAVLMHWM
jgi:hypothetical protein